MMECGGMMTIFMAFILGYTVTGLVGFGGNVLILPLLSLLGYPVHDIVVVMACVSFINALYRLVECHKAVEWGKMIKLWYLTVPGAFGGVWLLKNLSEDVIKLLLGLFVMILACSNLLKKRKFETPLMLQHERKIKKYYIIFYCLLAE